MRNFILFLSLFFMCGCAPVKTVYVPTENTHKIEYKDSLVYIKDTVVVEVPKEVIREVKPIIDTSRLETKIAISEAFVDTVSMKLHHTLKNKPNGLKMAIDTVVIVKTKTEYLEKPIPYPDPVPYVPKVYKWSLGFSIIVLLAVFGTIIWKLKRWFI